MQITVIGPTYPHKGGISHYNSLLCNALSLRHDVKLISFKRLYPALLFPGRSQIDTESKRILEVNSEAIIDSINPLTWLKAALRLREKEPDILILHWWTPFFTPLLFSLTTITKIFTKSKVVYICHNVVPHEPTLLDKILTKTALIWSDYFIVHSEEDYNNLAGFFPDKTIIKSVHPTYDVFTLDCKDTKDGKDTKMSSMPSSLSDNVILFFGFVREYKGLRFLIEAMPHILDKINVDLIIAGEFWEGRKDCDDLIRGLNITKHVQIYDQYIPNEDIGEYFSCADVVVLPYTSATQSGIIQIAYSFDKPVITTNVGGLPDVVVEGKTGYIVPASDSEALAEAILRFFQKSDRKQFTQYIQKYKERFSWEEMVKIVENLGK